jgi:molybdopterin-guanine dinucleotide biosynthesis protein A
MKQDKAGLIYRGKSLLAHQFETLQKVCGEGNVWVSGRRPGFPSVVDEEHGLGPLEGLRSTLRFLVRSGRLGRFLVLPVDMPGLTTDGLSNLLEVHPMSAVTCTRNQCFPLVINRPVEVLTQLDRMKSDLERGASYSFQRLFQFLEIQELEFPELNLSGSKFFMNLNTEEEWNAAISQANDRSASRS